jgi:glycosyltransferase involved in cell wall biosynthesis
VTAPGPLAGRRVVLVVGWAGMGGAERQALLLVRHLLGVGAQVEVVALTDDRGRFRDEVEGEGVPWHGVPLHWDGGRGAKLRKLARLALTLRRLHPDVLVSYTTRPNVVTGLVWRVTGARLWVWTQHDLGHSTKVGRSLVTRTARLAPLLVASSHAAADLLVDELGARRDRVRVVPNTVEVAEPIADRAAWRERLDVDDGTVVATMLGHFHHGKDHATLLHAWRAVADEAGDGAVLVLAGRDGGGLVAAKALAYDLELGRSVRFLEDVADVGGLLAATDVGVLSSPSESSPNALLECLAAGLPAVATDAPGITEVLGGHQLAHTAPPGDAERLASALLDLVGDGRLREELGAENVRLSRERAREPAAPRIAALIADALRA